MEESWGIGRSGRIDRAMGPFRYASAVASAAPASAAGGIAAADDAGRTAPS